MAESSAISRFFKGNPLAFPGMIAAILVLVGAGIFLANQPAHGTWRYGICRTLLEFETAYPPSLDILAVNEDRTSTRIYFAVRNPFGNERIIQADCDYEVNGPQIRLTRLSLDRKPVPDSHVTYYNALLPTLLLQKKIDTRLPPPMAHALSELKRS